MKSKMVILECVSVEASGHLGVNMMGGRRMISRHSIRRSDIYILSRSLDLLHIEPYAGNGVSLLSLS